MAMHWVQCWREITVVAGARGRGSRRRRPLSALIFVGVAVTVGAERAPLNRTSTCSVPFQSYNPDPDPVAPPSGSTAALSELAGTVGMWAESEYGEIFAGLAMDASDDKIYVWRTESPPMSAAFDRAIRALPDSGKIVIYCAPYSKRQLLAWMAELSRDQAHWESRGLPLNSIGPVSDGTCVQVGTEDPDRAARELPAAYPEIPLCFIEIGPSIPFRF
jgi:hypothetical protein